MELKELLAQIHKPELREVENSHVIELWQDGEVTMTKSGSLYGRRNVHMVAPPVLPKNLAERYAYDFEEVAGCKPTAKGNICIATTEAGAHRARELMFAGLKDYFESYQRTLLV